MILTMNSKQAFKFHLLTHVQKHFRSNFWFLHLWNICTLSGNLERIVSIISTTETYDSPQLSCSFVCKILNHFKFRIRMKIQRQYTLITNFIRMIPLYIKQHFICMLEMSYSKQECKLFKNRLCVILNF